MGRVSAELRIDVHVGDAQRGHQRQGALAGVGQGA